MLTRDLFVIANFLVFNDYFVRCRPILRFNSSFISFIRSAFLNSTVKVSHRNLFTSQHSFNSNGISLRSGVTKFLVPEDPPPWLEGVVL